MLIDRAHSLLMLIDLQDRLLPAVQDADRTEANTARLIAAARRLDIPVVATEQYPKGLGRTVPGLAESLEPGEAVEKTSFNAVREGRVAEAVAASRRRQIVLTGAEAHVCVLQTALGLKAQGYWPVVVSDAVASRAPESVEAAIRRLTANGIEVVTTEMVLFEWLGEAGTSDFKALLDLIK